MTTIQTGKCTNFGLCSKADAHEVQTIPVGAEFICEGCKRPLTASQGDTRPAFSVFTILLLLSSLLVLSIGGGLYYSMHPGNGGKSSTTGGGGSTPVPPLSGASVLLRLSGSNTIGAELAPALVEAWLTQRGASGLKRESTGPDTLRVSAMQDGSPVYVQIEAHGSSTAFTDLAAGQADIGMASRKIKPQEASDLQARGLGDLTSNADERVLGLDGVAVIVNEANPTDSMTIQEIAAIFTGASAGQAVSVYALDDKSGTYDTFKDRVLGSKSLVSGARRFEDSKQLADAVARDRNGIGFVGLPYASGAKVVAVAEHGTAPLVPNVNTIRTESYALSRRLYFYLPDTARIEARDFVRFALDKAGQAIVEKSGFVGQDVSVMAAGESAKRMTVPGDRLSVDFRFRTGSSQLDTKAVDDIKRVAAAMNGQYSGRGVMLIGFADNTGGEVANLELSKQRAQAVADQIKRQGIMPVLVTGFGQELPVSDNGTPEGREKNRRVEIWLRR